MNRNRVSRGRIGLIEGNLGKLERLIALRREDFLSGPISPRLMRQNTSFRSLLRLCLIVLPFHCPEEMAPPGSRREVIKKLLQECLMGREEIERYGELIDIRNQIVRLYVGITDDEILQEA